MIKEFTGISDPYEEPEDADLVLLSTELSPEQAAQEILLHLEREGYVGADEDQLMSRAEDLERIRRGTETLAERHPATVHGGSDRSSAEGGG